MNLKKYLSLFSFVAFVIVVGVAKEAWDKAGKNAA
jgi:hypothetical protein